MENAIKWYKEMMEKNQNMELDNDDLAANLGANFFEIIIRLPELVLAGQDKFSNEHFDNIILKFVKYFYGDPFKRLY